MMRFFLFQWTDSVTLPPDREGLEYTLPENRMHFTLARNKLEFVMSDNKMNFKVKDNG